MAVQKAQKEILDTGLEEEIILRQSLSDPEAFRPLYEKYYRRLFLFLLHRTGEKEIAADLCQQVFLKALRALGKFQFRGLPFSAWLYRIAINECNDFFRKTKRARLVTLDDSAVASLYEEMTADHTMEDLERALPSILQLLKEEELHLIELRFFEGRHFKEIADILQITENHARVKTYRILDKMKLLFVRKK